MMISNHLFRMIFPLLLFITYATKVVIVKASTPTAAIDVYITNIDGRSNQLLYKLHASQSNFGSSLPRSRHGGNINDLQRLTYSPVNTDDEYLCNESQNLTSYVTHPNSGKRDQGTFLVPRGLCTFEWKALSAQRLGASGIIIYNNLSSRYGMKDKDYNTTNTTNITSPLNGTENGVSSFDDIEWPLPQHVYECDNGWGWISKNKLSFDPPPYNGTVNGPLLTGTAEEGNLCAISSEALGQEGKFKNDCKSQRCLLTGRENSNNNDTDVLLEGCCAWDVHQTMSSDWTLTEEVVIPALFVTMEQGSLLLPTLQHVYDEENNDNNYVGVVLYERWYPKYNVSSVLIWLLGTFVTALACYMSAAEYRNLRKKVQKNMTAMEGGGMAAHARTSIVQRNTQNGSRTGGPSVVRVSEGGTTDVESGGTSSSLPPQAPSPIRSGAYESTDRLQSLSVSREDHREQTGLCPDVDSGSRNESHSSVTDPSLSIPPQPQQQLQQQSPVPLRDQEQPQEEPPPLPQQQQQQQEQPQQQRQQQQRQQPHRGPRPQQQAPQAQSIELNMYHALAFLVFASAILFILFFFKIYNVVKILYGLGCSGAVSTVIFYPIYYKTAQYTNVLHVLAQPMCGNVKCCGFHEITRLDVMSGLSGYGLGISWLYVGFAFDNPSENAFYWVTQDIMGASLCIVFLTLIRLNSIKVASVLLVAAFVYDIFFVFITPFIFEGDSVMVTVATSGGEPDDPNFCEKYPDDKDCQGGDPLPMVFTIPRINDYRGGSSLLGLGDIVLPGLLISFAARLDEAKELVGVVSRAAAAARRAASGGTISGGDLNILPNCCTGSGIKTRVCNFVCSGYYGPLVIAYAVGLFAANIAVYLMQRGQPALLYLVPACLGTMLILGRRRSEIRQLWAGPMIIKRADRLVLSVRSQTAATAGGGGGDGDGGVGGERGGEGETLFGTSRRENSVTLTEENMSDDGLELTSVEVAEGQVFDGENEGPCEDGSHESHGGSGCRVELT